jgi:hypothetical protein
VELLAVGLGVLLAGLAAVLTALSALAARRFGERRFLLFGVAFALIAAMAVLAEVAELDLVSAAWYDETFALEPAPLAIFSLALVLVYAAMIAPALRSRPGDGHGGP